MSSYKDTVRLPKTSFSMKGNLPKSEPNILEFWQNQDIYNKSREKFKDKETFILHDGPPYANGNLHLGHALNKVLKDIVVRGKQMLGCNAPYVPGWDCHGLPIEWKIEEEYKKKKINKEEVDRIEFRQNCRNFASKWLEIQKQEFKRLGILGDFENPYNTMDFSSEAAILKQIKEFVLNGALYIGYKPILWSVIEQTALAEAEVEYKDHVSDAIYVAFNVVKAKEEKFEGADILIWTTTPWTIPANRALACSDKIQYSFVEVLEVEEESLAYYRQKIIVAKALLSNIAKDLKITKYNIIENFFGLEGFEAKHPLYGFEGYNFTVKTFNGDHVTEDAGTGIVHTAPSHGEDDFMLGKKHNLEMPRYVEDNGVFADNTPLFAGVHLFKVNPLVIEKLKESKTLMHHYKLTHSYPHSWRSKAPLIYRLTEQVFISLDDENRIREKALNSLEDIKFYPKEAYNRLSSMIEGRPDWCISRQRSWGVPIAIFIHKQTGEILRDGAILDKVIEAFKKEGADAWFKESPLRFLDGTDYNKDDYKYLEDVIDVWFESGSTHAFVLEDREDLQAPADLYLEGSDQHRGWFQSSLIERIGAKGQAPYKAIMTHGFLLDGKGYKMSKSLGNSITPEEIIKELGADLLRVWITNSNFYDDIKVSKQILQQQSDIYRKIRNTLRYIVAILEYEDKENNVSYNELPDLEKYVLHNLYELREKFKETYDGSYDFHKLFVAIFDFCNNDLSSFYFDIRKDCLYCDSSDSKEFKATLYVFRILFENLVKMIAPFIPFTAEEVWQAVKKDETSVHLQTLDKLPKEFYNKEVCVNWLTVNDIRKQVAIILEKAKANKEINSPLETIVSIDLPIKLFEELKEVDFAQVCITSGFEVSLSSSDEISISYKTSNGDKCIRCWKMEKCNEKSLCKRCNEVVVNNE